MSIGNYLEGLRQDSKLPPREFLGSLAMMGVKPVSQESDDEYDDPMVHKHQALYNRAVHRILKAYGLKRLRAALKREIDGPSEMMGGWEYGPIVARDYAIKLLTFVKAAPDKGWV